MNVTLFWFRRDLRLEDNTALLKALTEHENVLPVFIFDESIISHLPADDARVNFIYDSLEAIDQKLKSFGTSLLCLKGKPSEVFTHLLSQYNIDAVYHNKDYEPYAITRDKSIELLLREKSVPLFSFKDHVIFEENEIVKNDGLPYTVYTPYKNKWLATFKERNHAPQTEIPSRNFTSISLKFPSKESLGIAKSAIKVKDYTLGITSTYEENRNFPAKDATSYLSPHLRFGTVSVRQIIAQLPAKSEVFLSELIWREFFIQILYHFPHVVNHNFRSKYDGIVWRNNLEEFEQWCKGKTGYPMVDAGMRELNETGYMHNRVRMITAGFLCKHLLIDWQWGEAYFASKLLDYELASNNGNWQWAAGTGCDAAPYFRIFNPIEQFKKFDKSEAYVRKWVKDYPANGYPLPMVEHKYARARALDAYKSGILV